MLKCILSGQMLVKIASDTHKILNIYQTLLATNCKHFWAQPNCRNPPSLPTTFLQYADAHKADKEIKNSLIKLKYAVACILGKKYLELSDLITQLGWFMRRVSNFWFFCCCSKIGQNKGENLKPCTAVGYFAVKKLQNLSNEAVENALKWAKSVQNNLLCHAPKVLENRHKTDQKLIHFDPKWCQNQTTNKAQITPKKTTYCYLSTEIPCALSDLKFLLVVS